MFVSPAMEPARLCEYLEDLLQRLGVTVRYENLRTQHEVPAKSGLCVVAGHRYFFMDRKTDPAERISELTACLAQMDLSGVYIKPAIRELVDCARRKREKQVSGHGKDKS
ncbi:MAG: hypothetical protein JRI36_06250 [Deltaproteobacteria bacterium]|nr:hypothetical protein [Deltaproteobacteria bacterium]